MMSGHGANQIFFNKKVRIGRPEHSLSPHHPTSNSISFLPYPPPTSSKWTSYVYRPLNRPKFRHIFEDTLNPLCSCSIELETTI